jgi:hypothetical protein
MPPNNARACPVGEPGRLQIAHDGGDVNSIAALAAAARGWHVFPLRAGTKYPACPDHRAEDCDGADWWCRDGHTGWEPRATADPDRIRRGWAGEPFNVGLACGPSGLVVVDLDMPKPGKPVPEEWQLPGIADGKDVFAQVCEWAGMDWPWTHTVATPSGGWHMYFTAPERSAIRNSASLIGPQVDVRAAGGYVVAAGSTVDGKAYEVLYDDEPAPLPAWIARLVGPRPEKANGAGQFTAPGAPGKRLDGLLRVVAGAKPGTRNDTLFWAASRAAEMTAAGHADERETTAQLLAAAAAAGLPEQESARTITSAMKGTR